MPHYDKNDPKSIQKMFGSIAKNYDRTNAVLSFQMHKLWNKELVRRVLGNSSSGNLLDLCCGTGEITFTYLKNTKNPCNAYMLDFCQEMLECAKNKAHSKKFHPGQNLSYIQADAQDIPLSNDMIDFATVAYGIRNIKDPLKCAQEVHRILRPSGVFGILELTEPRNPILRSAHQLYLRSFLPIMGKFLTSNQDAYQYLCNSIHSFIKPAEMEKVLLKAGFKEVASIPLTGGIATILIAKK